MLSLSWSGVVNSTVVTLMPKVLPYFFEVWDPWWGHWACLLWSYDWRCLCLQVVCISWSWWLLFFAVWRNTVFIIRIHSKIVWRFRNRKSIPMRHRLSCWWYIRIHKCWFFLHRHTILSTGHHTEITVSTVIARHLQTMGTPNSIQCTFPFTHALSLDKHISQHMCGANFLSWSPALQPKYKKYAFFIVGIIEHFLEANVPSLRI